MNRVRVENLGFFLQNCPVCTEIRKAKSWLHLSLWKTECFMHKELGLCCALLERIWNIKLTHTSYGERRCKQEVTPALVSLSRGMAQWTQGLWARTKRSLPQEAPPAPP